MVARGCIEVIFDIAQSFHLFLSPSVCPNESFILFDSAFAKLFTVTLYILDPYIYEKTYLYISERISLY